MIEYAVRTCLDQCARTDAPMTTLTDYLDELKEAGWDEASRQEFQLQVLKELSKPKE